MYIGTIDFLLIVEFDVHAIVNFVVGQRDTVLENIVPFLEDNTFVVGTSLRGNQLLQITNSVVRVAFNTDLLAQTIVTSNLNHTYLDTNDERI